MKIYILYYVIFIYIIIVHSWKEQCPFLKSHFATYRTYRIEDIKLNKTIAPYVGKSTKENLEQSLRNLLFLWWHS